MMKTPDERALPEILSTDWDVVLEHRQWVYVRLKAFAERILKRKVYWTGPLGQHQWHVSGGLAYGKDPVGIVEDLEYRALEAAGEAAHRYASDTGLTIESFMAVVIDRKLQSEFDALVHGDRDALISLEDVGEGEVYYLDEHDHEGPDDGLNEETRAKLQAAMGALSSREAWALRMHADGIPNDVIAERLGLAGEKSVYKIISTAKKKAGEAYDA